MRKRSKRIVRPAQPPCLVVSHVSPDVQIILLTTLQAFSEGWAEKEHFDCMLDTRDLLLLGANAKRETGIVEAALAINVALSNIRDSWDGKKFYFDADELNALKILVHLSNDFWNRQSGAMYMAAYKALKKWRLQQYEDQREQTGTN